MIIQIQTYDETHIIISAEDFWKLVEIAKKVEPIEVNVVEADSNTKDLNDFG